MKENLEKLRNELLALDFELIELLKKRSAVVSQISKLKCHMGIAVLQKNALENMQEKRIDYAQKLGVSEAEIQELFTLIHLHSVKNQTRQNS